MKRDLLLILLLGVFPIAGCVTTAPVKDAASANVIQLYAQINVSQETSGTKIACTVDRPGAVKTLDVTGYYSANNIYKEIVKILAEDEISYKKARESSE